MADDPTIKLTYTIKDIQLIPNTTVNLIGIEVSDGKDKWHKAFKVDYGRPISIEEFERDLKTKNLLKDPDDDDMVYIRELIDQPREIVITPELEKP